MSSESTIYIVEALVNSSTPIPDETIFMRIIKKVKKQRLDLL